MKSSLGRIALGAASLALLGGATDQTADVQVVARFLAKVRAGELESASAFLARGAEIADPPLRERRTLAQFAAYATACPLKSIYTVVSHSSPDSRTFPLGATWSCRYPEAERQASFWIERGRIRRLTFGPPMVIKLAPIPARPR